MIVVRYGSKAFLINSHLVYYPSYSATFRPTVTGNAKIISDCNWINTTGSLTTGVKFVDSKGTVGSTLYSVTIPVPSTNSYVDREYYPYLTAAASYKAFLQPNDGLHLYMNRATVWYQ